MNIGMILDNEFTGDLRVENEVIALQEAGFNVSVLCLNYGNKPPAEIFHGAKIIRISIPKPIVKKLRALTNTIFDLYTSFWANKISAFVKDNKIDVLHVHDLYMFGAAFKYRKSSKNSIKVVGDLHENYVEGLKHYKFSTTFPGNILISIKKWERTEVEWINNLDSAITVIEEAVDRYSGLGLNRDKFIVLPNYVNVNEFTKNPINESIKSSFENHKTLLYVGAFDVHRGLESIVKAMPTIIKKISNAKLILVGSGNNQNDLKKLSVDLNISNNVKFCGWQTPDILSSYIHFADVCVIPHLKTVHTDNTIPHKLFQYMLMEKPVIASDCNPLKRIIGSEKCGLIFSSSNPEDFAEKAISLLNNPALMNEMGKNGKHSVGKKYNWDNAANNLINLYKNFK